MFIIERQIGVAMDYVFMSHRILLVALEPMTRFSESGERKS